MSGDLRTLRYEVADGIGRITLDRPARVARLPADQLAMMKLMVNQQTLSNGLPATQLIGTVFDGIARHTPEGYAFQQRAAAGGFRAAVHERDEPFGDAAFTR